MVVDMETVVLLELVELLEVVLVLLDVLEDEVVVEPVVICNLFQVLHGHGANHKTCNHWVNRQPKWFHREV